MKLLPIALCAVISLLSCELSQGGESPQSAHAMTEPPFLVSVVPTDSKPEPFGKEITMADKLPGDFYVVLTNISKDPQAVFEAWNSWGYCAVSFEIRMPDGQKTTLSKKPQLFTKNYPSIFIVPPGEHVVLPIRLDKDWAAVPRISMTGATPLTIAIKAIYEVRSTPESAKWNVWTGHLESNDYRFKLNHR